jgi:hypothetical protein
MEFATSRAAMNIFRRPHRRCPATWRRISGGWELRFGRRLRQSSPRLCDTLTTGDGFACWLAEADIEANAGGRWS